MGKISVEMPLEELSGVIIKLPLKEREELWSLLATTEEAADPGALAIAGETEEDTLGKETAHFRRGFRKIALLR